MRTFFTVWFGQTISVVGTGLTGFALAVWVYQQTGSATSLAMILLAGQGPPILVGPFAGALVDRFDRRWMMILADAGAGIGTMVIAALLVTNSLEIWMLYPILAFSSIFQTFQFPAYSAATTLLVPKEQYSRAAGLVQLAEALGQVAAPAIAGVLLVTVGLETVIFVDVVTFLFAVGTLLVVRFPAPERSAEGEAAAGSLLKEAWFGFTYVYARKGLFALLIYMAMLNLVLGYTGVVIFPLTLAFASESAVGTMFSIAAIGMVVGSIVMSAWGGPERKMPIALAAIAGLGIGLAVMGLRPSLWLVGVAGFFVFFMLPVANSSGQAIWQAKVHPDVQGRVFAVRRVAAQVMTPIALVSAGPLADRLFEPLMADDGGLASSVGSVIGTGPGRGMGLFLIAIGLVTVLITAVGWSYRHLRNLEDELPDVVPSTPPAIDPDVAAMLDSVPDTT